MALYLGNGLDSSKSLGVGFSVLRQSLQFGQRISQKEAVRVNDIGDYASIIQRAEEDEVWPEDFVLLAIKVGDAERGLSRLLRIAIPEPEALAFRFGIDDRDLPIIQSSWIIPICVAEEMILVTWRNSSVNL